MSKSIKQEWEQFLAKVYPDGTVPEQLRQVRNAFYGGALVIFNMMLDKAYNDKSIDNKEFMDMLNSIEAEFKNYVPK